MMTSDANVAAILKKYYPASALRCMEAAETRFVVLEPTQKFTDVSPLLRRIAVGIDSWPVPAAGLFVVNERAVYLRQISPMVVCHEAGHALDASLGGGVYLSGIEPKIRRVFAAAKASVTPYSSSDGDEHFAECVRALGGRQRCA